MAKKRKVEESFRSSVELKTMEFASAIRTGENGIGKRLSGERMGEKALKAK